MRYDIWKMPPDDGKIYLPLSKIAPQSSYSAEYLRIRILQKKLRGVKIGREWHTTKEWLDEYVLRYSIKRSDAHRPGYAHAAAADVSEKFPAAYAGGKQFIPLPPVPEAARPSAAAKQFVPLRSAEEIAEMPPRAQDFKTDLIRRPDFKNFSANLQKHFPKKLFLAPLAALLLFIAVSFAAASPHSWPERIAEVIGRAGTFLLETPALSRAQEFGAAADGAIAAASSVGPRLAALISSAYSDLASAASLVAARSSGPAAPSGSLLEKREKLLLLACREDSPSFKHRPLPGS